VAPLRDLTDPIHCGLAPPRDVADIASTYRDEVAGDDPPAWVAAVRRPAHAEIAGRNACTDWRA
jgi:hypothetical protein